MKRFLLLILTIVLSLSLVACDEDSSGNLVDTEEQKEALIDKEFTPEIEIDNSIEENKIHISGDTNLPDETALVITLMDAKGESIEKTVTVQKEEFSLDPIPIEELKAGEQEIELKLSDDQPDSVVEVIGENGELLTGDLVDDNKQLKFTSLIDVPSERSPPSDVKGEKVKVKKVVDGDTIVVNLNGKEEKVRLILVDTPETKHPQMGVQPFGPEATEFTTKELEGKNVTLELGIQERDTYGRLLAYVWIGDNLFNQTLIERGFARVAVYPPNTKYLDEFEAAQNEAKKKEIGIWSIENYATDEGFKVSEKDTATESSSSEHSNSTSATKQEAKESSEIESKPEEKAKDTNDGECLIKGSANGIYHVPGSTYYERTKNVAEWFCSEEEAQKAGYRAPKR